MRNWSKYTNYIYFAAYPAGVWGNVEVSQPTWVNHTLYLIKIKNKNIQKIRVKGYSYISIKQGQYKFEKLTQITQASTWKIIKMDFSVLVASKDTRSCTDGRASEFVCLLCCHWGRGSSVLITMEGCLLCWSDVVEDFWLLSSSLITVSSKGKLKAKSLL